MFVDEVSAVVREVGLAEVVPRFQTLSADDVMEKSPGDLVTVADQECERVLSERLRSIRDVPVVGEEATAANPALLDVVTSAAASWIIDPIDGTSNFVKGDPNFVVMVSFVEDAQTTGAWIWHPETDQMLTAELGAGARLNGELLTAPVRRDLPTGILKSWLMGPTAHERLQQLPTNLGQLIPAIGSAGIEYGALVRGEIDFLFYWRTLPWDHAAGALVATECGLTVGRTDGTPYVPGDGSNGLLSATPALWDRLAHEIEAARESLEPR